MIGGKKSTVKVLEDGIQSRMIGPMQKVEKDFKVGVRKQSKKVEEKEGERRYNMTTNNKDGTYRRSVG